ncbi:MAG: TSUP family transporter [Gemmatimonadales bacterium]
MKLALFVALAVIGALYVIAWGRRLLGRRAPSEQHVQAPTARETAIGFGTNFFDTLGIGSYAPTTVLFRFFGLVPDERIPGTLTIGHVLPTMAQAFIYISIIEVEMGTLVLLILASVLGSWLGAGVVARWPRRKIQIGMGCALLIAAILFTLKNLDELRGVPVVPGGEALGLAGAWLGVAIAGNFVLGALMTLGIGLYAPCLIMISLLGMSPKAAFPIMMGSCAFLMPLASVRFLQAGSFQTRPALGLALGGVPAVLIAAFLVKALPLVWVRWLVIVVVLYASVGLLRAARRGRVERA